MPLDALYRGEPCTATVSLAWSNSGEMQIELIHQQDAAPSIFTEFLNAKGPERGKTKWMLRRESLSCDSTQYRR